MPGDGPGSVMDAEIKEKIRKRWDVSSQQYDTHHAHGIQTDEEKEAWIDLLRQKIPGDSMRILDVGCGTGEMSILLAGMGHQVTGVDLSEQMLAKARNKALSLDYSIQFEMGDAESLSWPDSSMDVILNRHLFWTLPHPDKAIQEWKRVLKPDGTLLVIDGNWYHSGIRQQIGRWISGAYTFLTEKGRQKSKFYDDDLKKALPYYSGPTMDQIGSCLTRNGFVSLSHEDLIHIQEIQRRYMPRINRLSYDVPYCIVSGKKPAGEMN